MTPGIKALCPVSGKALQERTWNYRRAPSQILVSVPPMLAAVTVCVGRAPGKSTVCVGAAF